VEAGGAFSVLVAREGCPTVVYLLSFFASFVAVGLKGFQHKNVIHGKTGAVFVTSYAMAAVDVLTIGLIVREGWTIAFSSGSGAAFGMVFAIKLHERLFGKGK
jgi:hypothetical protein